MKKAATVFVIVGVGALIAACIDSSGLATGSQEPPDGGSSTPANDSGADAGSTPAIDAGTEASSGGPNLLTNADFELGCAGWEVAFGTMSESTAEKHGGNGSCKFCMDTNWEAFFEQSVDLAVEAGKTYYAEAWFKPALSIQNLETAGYVGNSLRATSPGATNKDTEGPTLTGDWLRVTSLFKPTLPATKISVEFRLQQSGNPADTGGIICFYVDDVVLRRMD